jgi:uncharacterized membrane protein
MDQAKPALPDHIEETVRSIAELHARHHRERSAIEYAMDWMIETIGQPYALAALAMLLLGWVGSNLVLEKLGARAFDPPPFAWAANVGQALGLCITILVLITQRRQNRLAERLDRLTLELAALTERKTAKIIELILELRRDHPEIADRLDPQAAMMAEPADTKAVLAALAGAQQEMLSAPPAVSADDRKSG